MESGIYKITNQANGKFYIGSSNNTQKRWREHLNLLMQNTHYNEYLQKAWNKYGKESFKFSVIEEVKDVNILFNREQVHLDETRCYEREIGYNLCPDARTRRRATNSSEHRRKISEALTGRSLSSEHRKKISEIQKGKKLSEEHKTKTSETMKGRVQAKEHVENGRIAKLGSKNPAAKLTEDDVRSIRRRFAEGGITQTALAREYEIKPNAVSRIISRTRWSHVE